MSHRDVRLIAWTIRGILLLAMAAVGLAPAAASSAPAKPKPVRPGPTVIHRFDDQGLPGNPLTIIVTDNTQMLVQYAGIGNQFFDGTASGLYLWANTGGGTRVFGPGGVPDGNPVNAYIPLGNVTSGNGTPAAPWVITTDLLVPNSNLRLSQIITYVNGAEFVHLAFQVEQIGGSQSIGVVLFHAADLSAPGADAGYGYHDGTTGGVGDSFPLGTTPFYQQFVPDSGSPAPRYQEADFGVIWNNIGSTAGPGAGFNNSVNPSYHDAAAGLQWNLTIPASRSVTVGETDLFSTHAHGCGAFSDVPPGTYYYDPTNDLACRGIIAGYGDTTFRPGAFTTRGQLAKIAANSAGFTEPPSGQTFADVPPTNGFYPYIQRLANRGLISGYTCGGADEPCDAQGRPYFRWGALVTRGQLAKILTTSARLPGPPAGQAFTDVPPGTPFYPYVQLLAARGAISGYACGGPDEPCDPLARPYFRLGYPATRGQIAKIAELVFFH